MTNNEIDSMPTIESTEETEGVGSEITPPSVDDTVPDAELHHSEGDAGTPEAEEPEVDDDQGDAKPNRREAKYRVQLREVESKLATAEARVDALQRSQVEGRAVGKVAKPGSLWGSEHMQMDKLLNDNGTVDVAKVDAAIKAAAFELGLKNVWDGPVVPREGDSIDHSRGKKSSWQDAFSSE
jgi:hypothetical protein